MFKIGDKVYIKHENQGEIIDYFFFITEISKDKVTLMAVVDEKLTFQEHYEASFEFIEQLKNIELAENCPPCHQNRNTCNKPYYRANG